ncbi:Heat shock cognate 71 kDa protein, partial [Orchesella cincta]
NTKIPTIHKDAYRTFRDNQENAMIRIYQGESPIAQDNTLLGEFVLNGIPPAPAGKECVDVTMEIDAMGVLNVKAMVKSTRGQQSLKVGEKRTGRMSQGTKQKLLLENQLVQIRNPFLLPTSKLDDQKFEFIFMLDVSGSMGGQPIELAKRTLLLFLHSLPENCYFNVITFRGNFTSFFPASVRYTQQNLEYAKIKVQELYGSGGTTLLAPLRYVYSQPQIEGYLTQIFTITDGHVSNRDEVLALVASQVKHSRSFSLGIGNGVDRNLVIGIAENAGGMYEFVTYNEMFETKILNQLKTALRPALLKPIRVQLQLQEGMNLIFEKYKQQNDMNLETEPAIGIDLGTTYSCVAIYAKGKVHIIPNGIGKNTTPSYVAFTKDGKENIGEPAKNRAYENPEDTIFDAKRIIGRRFNDINLQNDMKLWPFTVVDDFGVPKILAGGKKLHPEEISAKLLRELKKDAERYLQRDVKKAVITVPAYFTDGQRQATKDAGLMAGLEVLTVQTEPTAAAIAYKLQHSEGKDRNVLIFDLGGGTFDVAVLKMSKGKIEVLAVDGDTHLGGEDFDKNMMEYCAQEFKKKHKVDLFEGKDSANKQTKDEARRRLKRLQGECERKKIELATSIAAVVTVDRMHGRTDLSVSVTREMFNKLNENLFKKTIEVVDKALVAAKLQKSKIDDIVLVGGSTRIPKVQEMLGAHFGGKALDHYINPDEAVAYGAAMTAAYMNGTIAKNSMDFNKVQDVTPMSIGVEVYGGGFSVIIPKSTKVPVKLMERYKTAHNNQTSVQITIYQGEDKIAVHNQHLGDFYLNGIPPRAAELENIDVEMVINSQGILHVSAVSSSTGHKSVSIIENKFRMGSGAIQRFLDEVN